MPADPRTPSARLVALDVDGTLLDPSSRLPEPRIAALRAIGEADITAVLVTGKTWPSVRHIWRQCALDGPHVCCNGSAVVTADEHLLAVTALDPEVVDEVTTALRERDLAYAVYLDDGTSVTARAHPATAAIEALGEAGPAVEPAGDRRVLKILSVVGEQAEDGLRRVAADRARVQRTNPRFLEWNPASVDKGTGLVQVAGLLGIPMAEVVAVGDAENDLPMFAAAGRSVAVAGAMPRAVAAADLHLDGRDLTDYLLGLARGTEG
jgi:Cof subfamily protein (haloacid dehalogenase superfamily)